MSRRGSDELIEMFTAWINVILICATIWSVLLFGAGMANEDPNSQFCQAQTPELIPYQWGCQFTKWMTQSDD